MQYVSVSATSWGHIKAEHPFTCSICGSLCTDCLFESLLATVVPQSKIISPHLESSEALEKSLQESVKSRKEVLQKANLHSASPPPCAAFPLTNKLTTTFTRLAE